MVPHLICSILCGLSTFVIPVLCRDFPSTATNPTQYDPKDVIKRDVIVVGGGSTGTYSSIRLRDHGKSIIVVEKKATLGGHAEAWIDPSTGTAIDIGVIVFAYSETVDNYFARFNLSLAPLSDTGPSIYADFSTGQMVDFVPPSQEAVGAALAVYKSHLDKYPALQDGFNLSYPVDPELLISFGDFVAKYGLQDMIPLVFTVNQGASPLLNISMLYTFKYLNAEVVEQLERGFRTTEHHSTTELYHKAAEFLGPDVLFNSTVLEVDRSCPDEVRVAVQTPTGPKLVIAKKLLSTIPPMLENLQEYDLSEDEKDLFGQFFANGYYTGILKNTNLNISISAAEPDQPYNVPEIPGLYSLMALPISGGITSIKYGRPTVLPNEQIQADIVASIQRYQKENGVPVTEPEWLVFSSHSPFNLMVSNDAIAAGFYQKLYSLQGERNTFYNGAAWQTQDSSVLWKFTDDYIIPNILASLKK
ncbi:hypothetical protein JX265_009894 [Neoarthrinium moseri]|uniref:Uncharacterized protein n=1 Tax=Neoarthrinium moseri TaxID=1658444 RepID=A0A9Q0AKV8_9PEZI|nr:hypothetical protein JX265_009894 [Neoarthrinium moseri]